ncbi:hypothetical protein AALB16_03625 [Lachnospiraceae bacterium 62-35]
MKEELFDRKVRDSLVAEAEKVSLRLERQKSILDEIHSIKEEREGNGMKRKSMKKVIFAAAVMCVFTAFGAIAAGKIVSTSGSISPDSPDFTSFSQIFQAEEKLGFQPYGVETYSNGLTFEKGFLSEVNGHDESGNVVETSQKLYMTYKQGDRGVSISASKQMGGSETQKAARTEEYKGKTIVYREDKYVFLAPDAEPTAEMKAEEAAGRLYISYGLGPKEDGSPADPEEKIMYSVSWNDEGIVRVILSAGNIPVMGDSLIGMAKETIDAKEN